ncbi:hypothetical protein BH09MYX1_BH09MYX1_32420 [soil metagenome]
MKTLAASLLLLSAFVTGCAADYREARSTPQYGGESYGNTTGSAGGAQPTTTALAAPQADLASTKDMRFESDDEGAPPPPPPKPVRQIDRDGDKPAAVGKKDIDRAPATDGANGGAGQGQVPPPVVSAEVHGTEYLIYTAHVTMAVYQVGPGLDAVERIGREAGGYLSSKTDREVTIRIPRQRFDDTLKRVEGSGDVLHRDVRAQDVTDEFLDLDTRLKNARAMRQRFQELLAKASVKEAIDIEKELGRVTEEIESMEGKLKLLRDRIAFSTITVTFEARGATAVRDMPLRLPFPWLSNLGLPRLLSL